MTLLGYLNTRGHNKINPSQSVGQYGIRPGDNVSLSGLTQPGTFVIGIRLSIHELTKNALHRHPIFWNQQKIPDAVTLNVFLYVSSSRFTGSVKPFYFALAIKNND